MSSGATVTVSDVDGASATLGVNSADDEDSVIIFGGTAGDDDVGGCVDKDNNNTCNNCIDGTLAGTVRDMNACNRTRIYDGLILDIRLSSDSKTGDVIITSSDGTTKLTSVNNPFLSSAGNSVTLSIRWLTICSAMTLTSCEDSGTASFRIGVDTDNDDQLDSSDDDFISISVRVQKDIGQQAGSEISEHSDCTTAATSAGLCNFSVVPGDGKVFIRDLEAPDGFPATSNNITFNRILFLCTDGNTTFDVAAFDNITPLSVCGELEIEEESNGSFVLSSEVIEGLENNRAYYFKIASVDQAGNIGYFTPGDRSLDTTCIDGGTTCHFAIPGEVLGVLTGDNACFISTAAFGSSMHSKVNSFRKFRDRFMLTNRLGSILVDYYYQKGPRAARFIGASSFRKSLARTILWPAWLFAEMSLQYGLLTAIFFALSLLIIGLAMLKILFKKLRKRHAQIIALIFIVSFSPAIKAQGYEDDSVDRSLALTNAEADESSEPIQKEPPYPNSQEREYEITEKMNNKKGKKPLSLTPVVKADGSYQYEIEESPLEGSFAFHVGIFGPLDITNPVNGFTFEDIYGEQPGPVLFFDYDWNLFRGLGHLNLRFTSGAYIAQGKGRFADPTRADEEPLEQFTFVLLPNSLTVQYKFQYSDTQFFVPYIEGGAGYFTFAEFRDDNVGPKFGASAVTIAGGGLQILLDGIEPRYAAQLDRHYGVNHTWFLAEFKAIVGLDNEFDFTSALINIGFLVEY